MTDNYNKYKSIYIDDKFEEWIANYLSHFNGILSLDPRKFYEVLPVSNDNKPVIYGEIGSCYGGSAISVMRTLCKSKGSKVHCIDPWIDHDDYAEYKGEQDKNFSIFWDKMNTLGDLSKLYVHRGFSADIMPTFENEYFDVFFIDGNHTTINALEDAIHVFPKVKKGGWIIFDDYSNGCPAVVKGVHLFLEAYSDHFTVLTSNLHGHFFCKKKD